MQTALEYKGSFISVVDSCLLYMVICSVIEFNFSVKVSLQRNVAGKHGS